MKKCLVLLVMGVFAASCATEEGGVVNKVLSDFGMKERPEGYVSGSDKVLEQLRDVGAAEMKRLNIAGQHGTTKFQKTEDLKGKYYKEVKVYENFHPTDAAPMGGAGSAMDKGYYGYIEYSYRMYQSERKNTEAEAAAATADIPTDITGHESMRYSFNGAGTWMGGKGERAN